MNTRQKMHEEEGLSRKKAALPWETFGNFRKISLETSGNFLPKFEKWKFPVTSVVPALAGCHHLNLGIQRGVRK
jgi:hypothetical protein